MDATRDTHYNSKSFLKSENGNSAKSPSKASLEARSVSHNSLPHFKMRKLTKNDSAATLGFGDDEIKVLISPRRVLFGKDLVTRVNAHT